MVTSTVMMLDSSGYPGFRPCLQPKSALLQQAVQKINSHQNRLCHHLLQSVKNLSGAKGGQLKLRELVIVAVNDNLQDQQMVLCKVACSPICLICSASPCLARSTSARHFCENAGQ